MPCVIRNNAKASAANYISSSYKAAWLRFSYGKRRSKLSITTFEIDSEVDITSGAQCRFPYCPLTLIPLRIGLLTLE